jgi:hypothetical protein
MPGACVPGVALSKLSKFQFERVFARVLRNRLMQSLALHADARAGAREAARLEHLERRLARFQPRLRSRVRTLAQRHPRLMDLASSFPALLFELASPRVAGAAARAIARVIDGAPLREVAEIVGVPMWLRPVDPAAFGARLPDLPYGDLFRHQIGNYLPKSPQQFDRWAQAVSNAHQWSDAAVALWLARELHRGWDKVRLEQLRLVCLWAWF